MGSFKNLKFYKDKELTQEITDNSVLPLGIVSAGDSKEFKFYVYNDSKATLLDLQFIVTNEEVEILEAPKEMAPLSVDELVIKWSPSIDIQDELDAPFRVTGRALFGKIV